MYQHNSSEGYQNLLIKYNMFLQFSMKPSTLKFNMVKKEFLFSSCFMNWNFHLKNIKETVQGYCQFLPHKMVSQMIYTARFQQNVSREI